MHIYVLTYIFNVILVFLMKTGYKLKLLFWLISFFLRLIKLKSKIIIISMISKAVSLQQKNVGDIGIFPTVALNFKILVTVY